MSDPLFLACPITAGVTTKMITDVCFKHVASSFYKVNLEGRVMPQSHTQLRSLTESYGSNRSRPQKNWGRGLIS